MKNKALTVLCIVLMAAFIYFGLNTNKAQADAVQDITKGVALATGRGCK